MEQENTDMQEDADFEVESETENQAVAVAPNPAMNGNHAAPAQPRAAQMPYIPPGAKISFPMPATTASLMNRVNNRPAYAQPKEKEKDDREFLDAFNLKAEADDYELSCTRNQPSVNSDGDQVPTGINSKHQIPIMNYDDLQQQIIEAWGGGVYRVVFVEKNSGRRADNIPRCINIQVPTTQHPPKREKFEKVEIGRSLKNIVAPTSISEDERIFKEELEEDKRQARRDQLEQAKAEREYKKVKREKEIEMMRRELLAPKDAGQKSIELVMLEKRLDEEKRVREEAARKYEEDRKEERRIAEEARKEEIRRHDEDRKESARRSDEDRKMYMDGMAKLTEKLTEVSNRPAPPKDNTLETMVTAMVPVLAALVSRPAPPVPDNKELIMAMSESQRTQMQLMTTALAKPPDNSSEKMFDAILKVSSKQDAVQQQMISGMMATLLEKDKGQILTPDLLLKIQDQAEKRLERITGMGHGGQQHAEGDEDSGYDPALGFMGNAGKAIFSGLKGLMDSAATNPQLMELVMKLVGTRNPTDQQLIQVAQQWDQTGVPPAMQRALPGYAPMNQQAIPYAPQQQVIQHPPQQRPMPPSMPGAVPQQQNPPPQAMQQSVANELEGGASGLPTNGDPEQQRPPTPEELAEENLIDAVTRTIEIIIGEASGKPEKRTWPEDATDHWNKAFIKTLVECHDNRTRLNILGTKCDPAAAAKISEIWKQDVTELNRFWLEFNRFIDMNKPQPVAVQTPAPIEPPPVVPPVV